jgi:hypothetical protein
LIDGEENLASDDFRAFHGRITAATIIYWHAVFKNSPRRQPGTICVIRQSLDWRKENLPASSRSTILIRPARLFAGQPALVGVSSVVEVGQYVASLQLVR